MHRVSIMSKMVHACGTLQFAKLLHVGKAKSFHRAIHAILLSCACSYRLELLHAIAIALSSSILACTASTLLAAIQAGPCSMQAKAYVPKRNYQAAGLQLAGSANHVKFDARSMLAARI